MFQIHIGDFTGPLDLLLQLIEKEEMEIIDVNISKITNKYLEIIDQFDEDMENLSDFLDMVSTLIYIKSRELLPVEEEEEEEINEEILKQRLIEYKKYKNLAMSLKDFYEDQNKYYTKFQSDLTAFMKKDEDILIEYEVDILVEMAEKLFREVDEKDPFDILERDPYIVEDYMEELERRVEPGRSYRLTDFSKDNNSKMEIITIFLSLLELIKTKILRIEKENQEYMIKLRDD